MQPPKSEVYQGEDPECQHIRGDQQLLKWNQQGSRKHDAARQQGGDDGVRVRGWTEPSMAGNCSLRAMP